MKRWKFGIGLLLILGCIEIEPPGPDAKQETVDLPATAGVPEKPSASADQTPRVSWTPYNKGIKHGDFLVSLTRVTVGKTELKNILQDAAISQDDQLQIGLEIRNLSKTRKINYRGWGSEWSDFSISERASLEDEHGNVYRTIYFSTAKPVGQVHHESLYPGASLGDVVIFEEPIPAAKETPVDTSGRCFWRNGLAPLFDSHFGNWLGSQCPGEPRADAGCRTEARADAGCPTEARAGCEAEARANASCKAEARTNAGCKSEARAGSRGSCGIGNESLRTFAIG